MTSPNAVRLKILVVDADAERAKTVRKGLLEAGDHTVVLAAPDGGLVAIARQHKPDVLVVGFDAPDAESIDAIAQLAAESPRPVIVFADRSDDVSVRDAIQAGVTSYVIDGLSPRRVRSVLGVALARFQSEDALRRELEEAKSTLAERKIVERAKGILMDQRQMSEDEAYRLLRKMAMDQGRRVSDVAQSVIAVAGVLKP